MRAIVRRDETGTWSWRAGVHAYGGGFATAEAAAAIARLLGADDVEVIDAAHPPAALPQEGL